MGGKLNEHNWAGSVGTPSSRAITAIGDVANDAAFVWHSASQYVNYSSFGGNEFKVSSNVSWRPVTGAVVSFTSPACTLHIHASWQLYPFAISTPDNTPLPSFALRLNGQVISESILGGVETENDPLGGLGYGAWPHSISINIPVPSGTHEVDLSVKTLAYSYNTAYVLSREIIVLEMRRGR